MGDEDDDEDDEDTDVSVRWRRRRRRDDRSEELAKLRQVNTVTRPKHTR